MAPQRRRHLLFVSPLAAALGRTARLICYKSALPCSSAGTYSIGLAKTGTHFSDDKIGIDRTLHNCYQHPEAASHRSIGVLATNKFDIASLIEKSTPRPFLFGGKGPPTFFPH